MKTLLKRLKHLFYVGALVVILVVTFRPHGPSFNKMGDSREDALKQDQDSLLVGVSWPISLKGRELVNGIELAISQINEKKLVGDRAIELIVRDDQGETTVAQDIAREFAKMPQMSAVIGFADNRHAASTGGIYQASKLLQMIVGASSSELTRRDKLYLVHTAPVARDLAKKIAAFTATGQEPIKFAVITEKNGYQEEFAEAFTIVQIQKGGTRVYNRTYPTEVPPDFIQISHEIKLLDVDVILFSGLEREAGLFVKQAESIGLNKPLVCSCTDYNTLYRETGDTGQDIFLPSFYKATLKTEVNKRFVTAYQDKFASIPNEWAAQGYDAMIILARAVAESDSIDPFNLAWRIRAMPSISGVSGHFKFTSDGGLINKPVYIHALTKTQPKKAEKD